MKKFHRNVLGLCAALSASAFVLAADNKPAKEQSYEERYKVIWEQNMFVKDRRKPYSASSRNSFNSRNGERTSRSAESLYALRGVVLEEGQFLRAYFEDMSDGKMLRLNVGDAIARGRIAEIAIDAVAYEANGQVTWVNVGTDLRGQVAVLASSSDSPRTATSGPTTTAAGTGEGTATEGTGAAAVDPSTLSIEERMRQRRLQGK